eukprot:TRINITY_DN886_c0_g3_i1.p1 TRINITY_DN886_c0_g3~~TRINITY_DN886_c0_g3_i1.p1  ORF type:complete len:472 (+),score=87.09 TRINITY_DN886_c0_g3_i1:81-1496(+)
MRLFAVSLVLLVIYVSTGVCQPDLIKVQVPGLRPEGIFWNSHLNFLISSLATGVVNRVNDSGAVTPFVSGAKLQSTLGIQGDNSTGYLLIANTNTTATFGGGGRCPTPPTNCMESSLVVADLQNGTIVANIDLTPFRKNGTSIFANDVAADGKGFAYVTDTFGGQVVRVDLKTLKVETVISSDSWKVPAGTFGLNGIAYHNNTNSLIVAKSNEGRLYKLSLAKIPVLINEILLDRLIEGADGIELLPDNTLVVVGAGSNIFRVTTNDSWASGKVAGPYKSRFPGATTVAIRNAQVYAVHAHLEQPANYTVFEIEKINFNVTINPNTTTNNTSNNGTTPGLINSHFLGDWRSVQCEPTSNTTSVIRRFHFSLTTWNINATFYNDTKCNHKLYNYFAQGNFKVYANQTTAVEGASPGNFDFDIRTLTPWNDAAASSLSNIGCYGPFVTGYPKPLGAVPCPALGLEKSQFMSRW